VLLAALAAKTSIALDWQTPWKEPQDAVAAATRSDEYAWRLFVALNWPASPMARTADRTARFGVDRPVVWECWQSAGDVYLENGADPGPWLPADPAHPIAPDRRFETLSLQDLLRTRHIVGGVMVPLVDPISTAKRLTEIRMNRKTYEFIRARELYSLEGQIRAFTEGRAVSFPYGAKEVKAKWRPISQSQSSRYYTTLVTLADGTKRLYGLTGLHIVSKDLPHWFWATFEQVDNPTQADSEGWQLPSRDRFSCHDQPADCNLAPRKIGLEGTVWQYYRLRGTLTSFVDSQGKPELLANSELETGLQKTASCITCHSRASIGVIAGAPARLPIFDSSPNDAPSQALVRRGFSGLPKAEWYQRVGTDGQMHRDFRSLDFVWSLSQAKSVTGSASTVSGSSGSESNGLMPRPIAAIVNVGLAGSAQ
jgi:hypothetical protein